MQFYASHEVKQILLRNGYKLLDCQSYLFEETCKFWDVGMRPYSQPMIKHVNSLDQQRRINFKLEWCNHVMPLVTALYEIELELGDKEGAFNIYVCEKC